MIGSLAWFALMRRNLVYRGRNWISTLFEFLLPIAFIGALVGIRSAVDDGSDFNSEDVPPFFPGEGVQEYRWEEIFTPLTFADYTTAMQATRQCERFGPDEFYITGIPNQGWNWMVPFVKCDSRLCSFEGESASSFCEFAIIAVSPAVPGDANSENRTQDFIAWVNSEYPVIETNAMPFNFSLVQKFESTDAMDKYVTDENYGARDRPKIAMGIVWDEGNDESNYLYSLRQNSTNFNAPEEVARSGTSTTPDTSKRFDSFAKLDEVCVPEGGTAAQGNFDFSCTGQYLFNGVLPIQRLVHDFILDDTGSKGDGFFVAEAGVQYVQFPTRVFQTSGFFIQIGELVGLFITLGLLYPVSAMVRYITREKELRQKELMKMMSVTESDIGWSWFCSLYGFNFIVATFTALLCSRLYRLSGFFYIFIFWQFTFLSVTVFAMVISAITSKAIRAQLLGLLIFFGGFFLTLVVSFESGSTFSIGLVSMHPVAAFSFGLQEMGRLEDEGVGVTSNTANATDSPSGYTFSDTLRLYIISSILWGIVSWYLNRVIKPDYGQALPWWFPFSKAYWLPGAFGVSETYAEENNDEGVALEPVGEDLRRQAQEGKNIEIHGLRKEFGEEKVAVDGLSMSMYSGQITALLGHNGAGKTTTISLLTGALQPTSGYATVYGKDIRTQSKEIRKDLGICLQHDCLFPDLTVREHVQFFARIKGFYKDLSTSEANSKIDQSIKDVALWDKRNTRSKNLSGGMKRKLSVAIAFCGGSKVVLLDEPTSGMDPFSRRFTWNVIRQYRQDRCIILTTHFMDEADILGDRIAIMAEGRLRCAGSSLFLKKTYGVGYQLTIEKARARDEAGGSSHGKNNTSELYGHDVALSNIVAGAVPQANLLSNVGSEMSFQLPIASASNFTDMFDELDKEKEKETIVSYGVGITTLDEVFLVVARGSEPSQRNEFGSSHNHREGGTSGEERERSTRSRMDLESNGLFTRHVGALLQKRVANFRRDKKAWCCTTIIPSLFVFLGLCVITFVAPDRNLDPILLDLGDYNPDVSSSPVNPIQFNEPSSRYTCQPGRCATRSWISEESTGETYYFCGAHGRLDDGDAVSCSIEDSENIVGLITDDGAVPLGRPITTVNESSHSLFAENDVHTATQYGAVFITHEPSSIIEDRDGATSSFNDTVVDLCNQSDGDYIDRNRCRNFAGYGFLIQYNFTALHNSPLFQVLADEALARLGTNNEDFNIQCTIAPLPQTRVEGGLGAAEDAFTAWFLVVLSFPFIAGAFASFIVLERESKAKHLQTVAGVKPSAYWLSTFLWDVLNYQLPLWITVIMMVAMGVDVLTTSERNVFSGVVAILFFYGPAAASFTYCVSFFFKSASLCNMFIIIFGFLIGFGGPLTTIILTLIGSDPTSPRQDLVDIANTMTWVLRTTPAFCLGKGLYYAINIEIFGILEEDPNISAWSGAILRDEVRFLILQSAGYLGLAIMMDIWSTNPRFLSLAKKILCCTWMCGERSQAGAAITTPDDNDVLAEELRVSSGEANDDLIVVSQLTKVYDNGKLAVNNMSLGIAPGECFGLLGINGAGKTTTMQMLTAEFPPTQGDATLAGFSVVNQPEKTRRRIGYCPQFDAHFANMSGREHVELYASIKGIPLEFVKEAAASKLKEVGLSDEDSKRLSAGYSGGMKRRLSLACATIGQPQIVFLDECSTGVDPVARREIWQLVSDMVSGGNVPPEERTSVILTTHSMEECEALCPRIGIMANGRLRCLGSAQHLKSKFGKGYQIELRVQIVDRSDYDYIGILQTMESHGASFNLDASKTLLENLTQDTFLSDMLTADNPVGYGVYKDAIAPTGVAMETLATFATIEMRMRAVETFMGDVFKTYTIRERQDSKCRFEVSSEGVKLGSVFSSIEENKERLRLADYGVSQTSLEQVFNMHAAEAERMKEGRNDG